MMLEKRWVLVYLLLLVACSASTFGQAETQGRIAGRVDAFMQNLEAEGYAGSLIVEAGGQLILAEGYGAADRETGTPVTVETVFDIGSVTKQFTAAAILKLEAQGRLAVGDPISRFFGNVPEDKKAVTLHQLLTHTAGFQEGLGDDYQPISRGAYLDLALCTPLAHPPGATYSYSNVGYSLLAAVIELVTGQPYEVYLRENLFRPAGMAHTGYVLPDWQDDRLAHGYTTASGRTKDRGTPLDYPFAEDGPYWNLRGNGGILSTAADMYRWHQALRGNAVLSEASKKKLFTPHVAEGYEQESYYGYGWVIVPTPLGTLQTHNGGNGIFFADVYRFVDADTFIFITSSMGERNNAAEVSRRVAELVFE